MVTCYHLDSEFLLSTLVAYCISAGGLTQLSLPGCRSTHYNATDPDLITLLHTVVPSPARPASQIARSTGVDRLVGAWHKVRDRII